MEQERQLGQGAVVTVRQRLEFAALWVLCRTLGALPRRLARAVGAWFGRLTLRLLRRMRRVGMTNLAIAFPESEPVWRDRTLRRSFEHLGYLLAEFCLMARYSQTRADEFIAYDGLEHFEAARQRGHGVLVLTAHLGAWELSSFYHALVGRPMGLVIRRLDNPLVDRFVNAVRCLHGNRVIHKDDFARGIIRSMRRGETVGILMDTNMTPPQGVFVPFFGLPACTASGLARIAAKTQAAVLPGFLLWDDSVSRYRLHFGPALQLEQTGNTEADVLRNTALFNRTLEGYIRQHPEQWLWVHRRWKTRPAGETGVYG